MQVKAKRVRELRNQDHITHSPGNLPGSWDWHTATWASGVSWCLGLDDRNQDSYRHACMGENGTHARQVPIDWVLV